jgi:hypothetical protein
MNDWPLALCDVSNLNADTDVESMDLLYPDLVTENTQVYFSSKYRWWYLSDHDPSELLVFLQADIQSSTPAPGRRYAVTSSMPRVINVLSGVPHSAFKNPLTSPNEDPRESIEVRILVYYE